MPLARMMAMLRRRTAGFLVLGMVGLVAAAVAVFVLLGGAPETAAFSAASTPAGPPPALTVTQSVPILMYHYVDESPPDAGKYSAGLTVSTATFEAQMDYLAENGYNPVTVAQVYAALSGEGTLPGKPVAITFDDGGKDNYSVAYPILQRHGFRATFFVITGYVGNRLCMTWDQLREMRAGGMDIESHTVWHPDLRRVTPQRLAGEMGQARAMLRRELGTDARFLSYPYGRYNDTVIAAAQAAGYRAAVTTHRPGRLFVPISCYVWQRTNISPRTGMASFARIVAGTRKVVVR
jgi:peptidoglycan/xylan/chitin deacetylase (PgdA/CDA1 family)